MRQPVCTPTRDRKMHILLVEDDPILGRALEVGLEQDGLAVNWQRDGEAACRILEGETRFDGLLLDLGLPNMDGFDVLHRVRQTDCCIPIVVVTARTRVEDCIRGLNSGADDYLIKPFELVELLARIRAVKRRRAAARLCLLRHGDIAVDVPNHRVTQRGQPIWVTGLEFSTLCFLMREGERTSIPELTHHLWLIGGEVDQADLQVCLRSLSRKLGHAFTALQTVLHTHRRFRLPH